MLAKASTVELSDSTARAPTTAAPMPNDTAAASARVMTSPAPCTLSASISRSPLPDWTVLPSTDAMVVEVIVFSASAMPAAMAKSPTLTDTALTSAVALSRSCASIVVDPASARASEPLRTWAFVVRVTVLVPLAPAPAAAAPNPMAAAMAKASGVATSWLSELADTVSAPVLARTWLSSMAALVVPARALDAFAAAMAIAPAMKPPEMESDAAVASAVLEIESVALSSTARPAVTPWAPRGSSASDARMSASTVWVMVLLTKAPAPAPASEKPKAADSEMATPVPLDMIELSASAVCLTSKPASTSLSLMRVRTVPPSATSALAKATATATDAPAAKEPATDTPNTLLMNAVSSVAVSNTEPAAASTSEPSSMSASTRFVDFSDAIAPAAATEPEIAPAPPNERPTATPTESTEPSDKAISVMSPLAAVASDAEMIAWVLVPKSTSATDTASVKFSDNAPAPPTATDAAVSIESTVELSVAVTVIEAASTSEPSTMLASTAFFSVLMATTALTARLIDTPAAPPADTPTDCPKASRMLWASALTETLPPVLFTTESSMVASRLPPIVFSAMVSDTVTLTESAPAPPAATVIAPSSDRMWAPSSASTVTSAPAVAVLATMLASMLLSIRLNAITPAPATLIETPPAPPAATPTAMPNDSISIRSPASTLDAITAIAPEVSTSEPSMLASSEPAMLLLAKTPAPAMFKEKPPAPPADTAAATRTARMSEVSVALTVTAPSVALLASTSLPPLMLASTELVVVLFAPTPARATLNDAPPAPPKARPTATPIANTWLSADASTVISPPVLSTVESSMVASRLPPIVFWA